MRRAALILATAAVWLAGCHGTTVQISGSERGIDRYRVALPF
ncbi:MAG TPA: hypothetical protein VEY95_09260 [Azospirillaceae bacterium]|nr:hypothetical protein [Azospirillaceae bacterium]